MHSNVTIIVHFAVSKADCETVAHTAFCSNCLVSFFLCRTPLTSQRHQHGESSQYQLFLFSVWSCSALLHNSDSGCLLSSSYLWLDVVSCWYVCLWFTLPSPLQHLLWGQYAFSSRSSCGNYFVSASRPCTIFCTLDSAWSWSCMK